MAIAQEGDPAEVVSWYEGWADLTALGEKQFFFLGTHTGAVLPATDVRLNGQPCGS